MMRGKRIQISFEVIFQSLKDLLQSEIEGREGFLAEINREDTFYLVRKVKPKEISYFASIQTRARGVYFQLHNTPFFGIPFLRKCPGVKVDPNTRSLLFSCSIEGCEAVLRELIKKAL